MDVKSSNITSQFLHSVYYIPRFWSRKFTCIRSFILTIALQGRSYPTSMMHKNANDLLEVTQMVSTELLCQLWKSASEMNIPNISLLEDERLRRKTKYIVRNIQPVEKDRTSPQHLIFFPRTNHSMGFPSQCTKSK